MHIHILGICGTFMGGIALIAREMGYRVTGSDANVYPPMSLQLQAAGIELMEGYRAEHLSPAPDMVVVGNAMSRGNPAVEAMLDQGLRYTSGPQWLAENLLQQRWVLAVAGTHGKTSTASMLAWILESAGLRPGFLIGGVPGNFGVSARIGGGECFVVEADEYDTAFFDKRSKFIHYRPRTLVLNNLEFDHADIFDDLQQIQRQFHHLLRTVPGSGLVVAPMADQAIDQVLAMGCWTAVERFAVRVDADWSAADVAADGSRFRVLQGGEAVGDLCWPLTGMHNVANALAALAAARHVGVPMRDAVQALGRLVNVRRRMELRGEAGGVRLYDDFAHHPTAIQTTLAGLRAQLGESRILAILEPRSNTMRMGVHADRLPAALADADRSYILRPSGIDWDLQGLAAASGGRIQVLDGTDEIIAVVSREARPGDTLLVMSNGGFDDIHRRLLEALAV